MDKSDEKPTPVPVPVLSDDERVQLDDPLRLVKGLEVEQSELQQAVSMMYSVLHNPKSWAPETYVLSLPAAAKLARGLQEAVDKCLYRS